MAGNILYVEDEEFLGQTLEAMLKKAGYEVTVAPDGEQGLALALGGTFDLVLLDLLLPKMDGFEVLKRIKEDPKVASLPVIVLSNLGTKEDEQKTLSLGAKAHFVKALIDPRKLIAHVKTIVAPDKV